MPEMRFVTRWPDGRTVSSYSPSLVMHDYLRVGESYEVADFLARSETALREASDRVKARYGMACTSAAETVAQLRALAAACTAGPVIVESMTGAEMVDSGRMAR